MKKTKMKNRETINLFNLLMKSIDIYGENLSWYIGNHKRYQTVMSGYLTLIIIILSFIFFGYSIVNLIKNRKFSFLFYDIIFPKLDDSNIYYYEDLEIFLLLESYINSYKLDAFQIKLVQEIYNPNVFLFNPYDKIEYNFTTCEMDYFTNKTGFSSELNPLGLLGLGTYVFCLNNSYLNQKLPFILTLPKSTGFEKSKLSLRFDAKDDLLIYQTFIEGVKGVKMFIKSKIPNPLSINNPIQYQVNSINLSKKPSRYYFKNVEIESDSSIIPYFFDTKKNKLLQFEENFDYHEPSYFFEDYFVSFNLSYKTTFIFRQYEKIDSILANCMAIFNVLNIFGKILNLFFTSYYKEFFIYNYALRNKLKQNGIKIDDNQHKIIGDNIISNYSNIAMNSFNSNKEENIKYLNNVKIFSKNFNHSFNKKYINNRKEDEIKLNMFQKCWFNLLMFLHIKKSKYKIVDNAMKKINLIQHLFDSSIYINIIFDIMKLKKLLFDKKQLIIFENIRFTFDEINNYFMKCFELTNISNSELKNIINYSKDNNKNKLADKLLKLINN